MKNAIALLEHHGTVLFSQQNPKQPVIIRFMLHGFEPQSVHAIHIHEYGDLRDGCKSLGGHFNPQNNRHSEHAGDLFHNFKTNEYGEFQYVYSTSKLSLYYNDLCILGRSIVIHAFPDDYGAEGLFIEHMFIPYKDMSIQDLAYLSVKLGYPRRTRQEMVDKLIQESRTTGNASTRIDCGIIALTI